MTYIKQDDALRALCKGCRFDSNCIRGKDACNQFNALRSVPAAAVEPKRMTGVWLVQPETPSVSSNRIYRCSVCGYADEQSPSADVPYCWHCGSRNIKMFPEKGESA